MDLGEVQFCNWMQREFFIENTGKVTFEFKVLFNMIKKKGFVECSPCLGKIIGGEKQRIIVRVCPVMPNEFKEIIMVQVGYFEPEPVTITGKGFYPAILMNVPRVDIPEFRNVFDAEFEKKKNEREAMLKR